jgi:hypothetical protein
MLKMTEMMMTMIRESQRETRELVLSILQGRPSNGSTTQEAATQELTQMLIPPNYDDDSIPLPGGIQAVFEREEMEQEDLRRLRTEQENLARQLEEARLNLTDPQGPGSINY